MNSLRVFLSRLMSLFGWQRRERVLQDEIRFHLDMQIEENIRRGMTRFEAEDSARRSFGGIAQMQETYRHYGRFAWLDHLGRDLRFGLRMLRKAPGFSAVAILTIALGIGINASVFSLLNAMALRPLPLPNAARLVSIYQTFRGRHTRNVYGNAALFSYPEYVEYRDHNQVFQGLTAYSGELHVSLDGNREKVAGDLTACNYFQVLQSPPALGRGFLPEECAGAGSGSVIVLSHDSWSNVFSADPAIVGKVIRVNRQPMTVVGIAPEGFRGTELDSPAFWTPLVNTSLLEESGEALPAFHTDDNLSWLVVVGRLRDGVSLKQARAQLKLIAAQIDQRHPGRTTSLSVNTANLMGLPEERAVALAAGTIILIAVGLVLLIGCANLTNLMLARAAGRRREIAVRLAIGAARGQIIRQLLTESLLLAFIGGALGSFVSISFSGSLLRTLVSHLPPDTPKMALALTPDIRVFAYCLALMVATGLLFGLVPALQATRPDLTSALKQEDAIEVRRGKRSRLRGVLIASQVAICSVLLLSAGLLLHGLVRGQQLDPGFDIANVAALRLDLEGNGYGASRAAEFRAKLLERIRAVPNIDGAAEVFITPLSGTHYDTQFALQNESNMRSVERNWASPEYFGVLGIPLVRGRNFTQAEARTGAPVAILTEATARSFWPGEDAIGKRLHNHGEQIEIIGVTRDTHTGTYQKLDNPYLYMPLSPAQAQHNIVVHFTGPYSPTAEVIRGLVRDLDPNVLAHVARIEDNLVTWIAPAQVSATLAGVLGGLGLLLTGIGIYGTVAYTVSRRLREISIRVMLGAHSGDVLKLVLSQAMRPVMVGAALGAALSIAAAKVLPSLLFGLGVFDAVSFAPTLVFLMTVALLAAYFPARRALRVDPMQALRQE